MDLFTIRNVQKEDREWIKRWLIFQWGAEIVVSHDTVFVTYHFDGDDCEIVTLDSLREGIGIGAALIEAVKQHAQNVGCKRLFLVTTNDNIYSLRFYQKRGFRMTKINIGATDRARKKKPEISTVGYFGIPIHDEIELEYRLE